MRYTMRYTQRRRTKRHGTKTKRTRETKRKRRFIISGVVSVN